MNTEEKTIHACAETIWPCRYNDERIFKGCKEKIIDSLYSVLSDGRPHCMQLTEKFDTEGEHISRVCQEIKFHPVIEQILDPQKIMSPEIFAEKMKRLQTEDTEPAHADMDELMCELLKSIGYGKGIEIFNETDKWYE